MSESRVRRAIIGQRRAAYWFPFVAPYLCRPRSAFHSAFTTLPFSLFRQCPHCRIRSMTTFLFLFSSAQKPRTPNVMTNEQKLLLHSGLELMSESSKSGALSLSSAARHIDFHSSRRIYVVLVAHSIALSLHYFYYTRVFKFRLVHKTNYLIYYQNFFALIAIWVTVYNILHSIQICFCVTILEKYICGIVC